MSLRWKKAWRDLWGEKARSAMVILSIAVGVFTFGLILTARINLELELPGQVASIHPASIRLHTSPFDAELATSVSHMAGIAAAEARFATVVRYRDGAGEWHDLQLFALSDYDRSFVDQVRPWRGDWPPRERTILLERNSLPQTGLAVGDTLWLETADGTRRPLPIAGLTHDMNQAPAQVTGVPYGYVAVETLEWLGLPARYNQLHLLAAERQDDVAHLQQLAAAVGDKLERDGETIDWTEVPEPGAQFIDDFLPTITLIMGLLGVLAVLLSVLLAINVIVAMLVQQQRQIGVMKAVGGRPAQIAGIYLRLVLLFGVGALLLAVPASVFAGHGFSRFIAGQLNFDLGPVRPVWIVVGLQVVVGLVVPLLAALGPIRGAAGQTVQQTLQPHGLDGESAPGERSRRLLRLQDRLPLSRPMRLSLRNTFRRRGRLFRTLLTLSLGGALFMTAWSVRASLFRTLEAALTDQVADVQIHLADASRAAQVSRSLAGTPGIAASEYWLVRSAILLHEDGADGGSLIVNGLPVETTRYSADVVEGRWLLPGEAAVVVPQALLRDEPSLALGEGLRLRIGDEEVAWPIVGVARAFQTPVAPTVVYTSADALSRLDGHPDRTDTLRLTTVDDAPGTHTAVLAAVVGRLERDGIGVRSTRTGSEDRRIFSERFNILTVILLVLAALLALVGGLGLMGTMSINVLERRREIGVLRAVGASNGAVMRIVVAEGLVIGLLSWAGALVLAQPISRAMSWQVGRAFLSRPLNYAFDWRAPLMWLAAVGVIAALSSLAPALSAVRLSVRETLAYE